MMSNTPMCKKMEIDDEKSQLRRCVAKCEKRIIILQDALQQYQNIIQADISVLIGVIETIDELARLTALKDTYTRELQTHV